MARIDLRWNVGFTLYPDVEMHVLKRVEVEGVGPGIISEVFEDQYNDIFLFLVLLDKGEFILCRETHLISLGRLTNKDYNHIQSIPRPNLYPPEKIQEGSYFIGNTGRCYRLFKRLSLEERDFVYKTILTVKGPPIKKMIRCPVLALSREDYLLTLEED